MKNTERSAKSVSVHSPCSDGVLVHGCASRRRKSVKRALSWKMFARPVYWISSMVFRYKFEMQHWKYKTIYLVMKSIRNIIYRIWTAKCPSLILRSLVILHWSLRELQICCCVLQGLHHIIRETDLMSVHSGWKANVEEVKSAPTGTKSQPTLMIHWRTKTLRTGK